MVMNRWLCGTTLKGRQLAEVNGKRKHGRLRKTGEQVIAYGLCAKWLTCDLAQDHAKRYVYGVVAVSYILSSYVWS